MKQLFTLLISVVLGVSLNGQVNGDFRSKAGGPSNWDDFNTWEIFNGTSWQAAIAGQLPAGTSAVEIVTGHSVILNSPSPSSGPLTINGTLSYDPAAASSLTVNGSITVNTGGTFTSPLSGTINTHSLSLSGDLLVNGIFDMNTFSTAAVGVTFTGAVNTSVNGTGTINFYSITVNKGADKNSILEINSMITLVPPTSLGSKLTITSGTFKLSSGSHIEPYYGTNTIIPNGNGRIWLNHANAVMQNVGAGTATGAGRWLIYSGTLQIDAGTFSYGGGGDIFITQATTIINGPDATLNLYGAFQVNTGGSFTMTAGNFNLYPQAAFNQTGFSIFEVSVPHTLWPGITCLFTGGTLTIADPPASASVMALNIVWQTTCNYDFTGSTIRFGDGVSDKAGSANGFQISCPSIPLGNIVVNNNPASVSTTRQVKLSGATALGGNLTINSGAANIFNLGGYSLTTTGNIINSGVFNADGIAGNKIVFSGTSQQSVSGSGLFVNNNVNNITLNSFATVNPGVDIQMPLSVSNSLDLTRGTIGSSNASPFTIGRSASSAAFTFIQAGGSMLFTPTFNFTGVTTINYTYNAPTPAVNVTTGSELPDGVSLSTLTINNPGGVTLNKPVSCTTLGLTSGILTTTGVNLLTVTGTLPANITGGSLTSFVNGPLVRTIPGNAVAANYKFPIGKSIYRLFEFESITTGGTGNATIRAEVFDTGPYTGTPGQGMGTINTDKYWKIEGNLGTVTVPSSTIRLTESPLTADNKVGQSNLQDGAFANLGGVIGTGTISSNKPVDYSALATGTFFRIGTPGALTGGIFAIGPNGPYAGYAGTFPTFQAAAGSVSDVTITGHMIFEFQGDYNPSVETFPVVLPSTIMGSGTATVTFRPAPGVATPILFSGPSTIMTLSGCDFVTIDGRPGGTGTSRMLKFNSTSATLPAIAVSNTSLSLQLQSLIIAGLNGTAAGGVLQFSAGTSGGHTNLLINNCEFDGGGTASNLIYSVGTAAALNSPVTITNNDFYNYLKGAAIWLGAYHDAGIISGNNIYQKVPYNAVAGTTYGIYLNAVTGNNFQIFNNNIGGSGPGLTGTWTTNPAAPAANIFTGIYAAAGSTGLSQIYNNKVQNFDWNVTPAIWTGIQVAAGLFNVGTNGANVIGSNTGNDNIKITYYNTNATTTAYGINVTAGTTVKVENNNIGSVTTLLSGATGIGSCFIGINAIPAATTINGNIIGSLATVNSINTADQTTTGNVSYIYGIYASGSNPTISNNTVANLHSSMTFTSATSGLLRGIKLGNGGGNVVVSNNQIFSLSSAQAMTGSGTSGQHIIGIDNQAGTSMNIQITGNTIYDLVNTSATGAVNVTGIFWYASASSANRIEKNLIHSFSTASGTSVQSGIYISYGGATVQNNVIRLGIDTGGLPVTSSALISGIYKTSTNAASNVYFNTVYIGGNGVSASSINTYALNFSHGSFSEDIKNNILVNMRSNAVASPLNYAVALTGTLTNLFSLDYNIYNISATDGKLCRIGTTDYLSMGSMQAAIPGMDLNSGKGDPMLAAPGAPVATLDLKPVNLSPAEGTGIDIPAVTDDFLGLARSGNTPVDRGAFSVNVTAPGEGQDIFSPVITYTLLGNTSITTGRTTSGFASATDILTGISNTAGTRPRIYFKKSGDANAFAGNTSADNGWKWVESSSTTTPYDFTLDYSLLNGGIAVNGDIIQYFVVAQDLALTPNLSFNPAAGASGTSVAPAGMTAPTSPNSFTIVSLMGSAIDVGTGYTYTSLTGTLASGGLFAALNAGAINSNIVVTIRANITEPGTVALNQLSEEGPDAGTLTLTIQTDGTARVLSGATTASSAGLITINGAERVTFDGGTGNLLTIRNSNASTGLTGPVLLINNGSLDFKVQNTLLESNSSTATAGVISGGATGTNTIIVNNCDIRDARGVAPGSPTTGIYSGQAGNKFTITNNRIYNFRNALTYVTAYGIYITNAANGCVITGNSFYMELGVNPVCPLTAIYSYSSVAGANTSHVISSNFIGGQAPLCGGGPLTTSGNATFTGIYGGGAAPGNLVQGNTISNILLNGTGTGVVFYGINNYYFGTNVTGNIIGSTGTPNSIQIAGTGASYGIINSYAQALNASNFEQNVVANITLISPTGSPTLAGIKSTGGTVQRNKIFNLGASSTPTPVIYGIQNSISMALNEFSNNMIALDGGSATNPTIVGFLDAATTGASSFFFNSVKIQGTSAGATNSLAFSRTAGSTYVLRNNILVNTRTGGTGKHYAISSTQSTGFDSDFNDLYVSGPVLGSIGAVDKADLTAWKATVITPLPDAGSVSVLPLFTSASDLHISADPNIAGKGTPVSVTIDIEGLTRCVVPDLGINQFSLCSSTLTVKAYLESLYSGAGIMRQAQGNAGNQYPGTTADMITVELHDATNYATVIYSVSNVNLNTDGLATVTIPSTYGGSYYLTIKHRNSVATVSSVLVSFATSSVSYDFSALATSAFGNNLRNIAGVFVIYGGDTNQDGFVGVIDLGNVDNQSAAFGSGYLPEDINGDGFVGVTDMSIIDNNSANFVSSVTP